MVELWKWSKDRLTESYDGLHENGFDFSLKFF